jgi:hypothetical protein
VNERNLAELIAVLWPDLIAPGLGVNHCILAARVLVEVGAYFGFDWRAQAVDVVVANQAAWELIQTDVPVSEWPEEAWSTGCHHDLDLPGRGYNGHVVVLGDHLIMDMAAKQFSRPHRGLVVDGPIVGTTDGFEHGAVFTDDETVVIYRPRDSLAYRDAPDWRTNYRIETAALIRALRAAA